MPLPPDWGFCGGRDDVHAELQDTEMLKPLVRESRGLHFQQLVFSFAVCSMESSLTSYVHQLSALYAY